MLFCIASAISNRDRFGALLTGGIAMTFFLLFAVNMGMVMGLMPVVGVPLPLVSYGGSAMLVLLAAFGLVQSAHVHRPRRPGLTGGGADPLFGAGGPLAAVAAASAGSLCRRRASDVDLTDDPAGAWTFDYVIYRPGGPVSRLHRFQPVESGSVASGPGWSGSSAIRR